MDLFDNLFGDVLRNWIREHENNLAFRISSSTKHSKPFCCAAVCANFASLVGVM